MAGELKQKQFVDNEVKPMVRQVIPELIERIEKLEKKIASMESSAKPKKG